MLSMGDPCVEASGAKWGNHVCARWGGFVVFAASAVTFFAHALPVLADEPWSEAAVIPADASGFATDIAMEGNVLLVGSPGFSPSRHPGVASLYDADTGRRIARLMSPISRGFGSSVALAGRRAIIAAVAEDYGNTDGAVYVIDVVSERLLMRIESPLEMETWFFGLDVAAEGDALVVGTQQPRSSPKVLGVAYVFDLTTGAQSFTLRASDGLVDDQFGAAVAIDETLVAVGAPYAIIPSGYDMGAVYCFDRFTGEELGKIPCPNDQADYSSFGRSIALRNGLLVAGDDRANGGVGRSGSVYIFDLTNQRFLRRLIAEPPQHKARFGASVATDSVRIIAGSPNAEGSTRKSGAAHVFSFEGGEEVQMLTGGQATSRALFGTVVAIDGHRAVVSATEHDPISPSEWKGAVYVYTTTPASLHLRVQGDCPGDLTISAERATPGGRVALVASRTSDFDLVATEPCRGTMISLGRPYVTPTPRIITADANGAFEAVIQVDESDCGEVFVQAVDLENCQPSNVLRLQ